MSLTGLLVHTVTILSADTADDRYGDAGPDWTGPTSTTTAARMVQRSATEILANRDADVTEWVAFLPGEISVDIRDRIAWGDLVFEVAGEPKSAVRQTDTIHHLEVPLRRVTG